MRTFGSTWETVYIIGVLVALMVHVSQGASAFPESFFIKGFLFLMLAHAAFPHGGLQRLHSGFHQVESHQLFSIPQISLA